MRFRRAVLLFGVFGVLASVGMSGAVSGSSAASPATGYVYWGNGSAIGRASLDGTGVNKSFVGAGGPTLAVAVDANYIYWIHEDLSDSSLRIGRANLDGTGVNQSFIDFGPSDFGDPSAITVDGNYIYWVAVGAIGRANLNGTGVNQSFIAGGWSDDIAVDGDYIYWATGSGGIARANLNGTGVNTSFITIAGGPFGVAVDGNHVYWAAAMSTESSAIGRANLDGSGVNSSFISLDYRTELSANVAVGGHSIFWSSDGGGIHLANLDGSCRGSLIAGPVDGIAVTPGATAPLPRYSVTYVGNGATGGSPPTDASTYNCATTVTVRGAGSLTRPGFVFNGWATGPGIFGIAGYRPGNTFSMPASNVTLYAQWAKKLSAGTTTCNRTFTGTGASVVVPAGARCWLIPGTHVKNSIVVKPNGTLQARGVTIGGNLTMYGAQSATICGSKIGDAVVATGGSYALGGPGCAGNTIISGNILVTSAPNNVWVWHNTVKNGYGLTVKYGAGAIDSIVGNHVSGNLLVEYSGPPVEVRNNHAATARCVGNKGQTGSGNVATGKNTCPR